MADTLLSLDPGLAGVFEGSTGTATQVLIEVARSGLLSSPSTVRWSTGPGLAGLASADGDDFAGGMFPSGILEFEPFRSSASVLLEIAPDLVHEADEVFRIDLSDPQGASLATASIELFLINDDVQVVGLPADGAAGPAEVFRFFDAARGLWLITASDEERASIQAMHPNFSLQGRAFETLSGAARPWPETPVHRLCNTETGGYFYTASEEEYRHALQHYPMRDEGSTFSAIVDGAHNPAALPVYRFAKLTAGGHHYTTDEAERARLQSDAGWRDEGIGFYTYRGGTLELFSEPPGDDSLLQGDVGTLSADRELMLRGTLPGSFGAPPWARLTDELRFSLDKPLRFEARALYQFAHSGQLALFDASAELLAEAVPDADSASGTVGFELELAPGEYRLELTGGGKYGNAYDLFMSTSSPP